MGIYKSAAFRNINLRVPATLFDQLKERASNNRRSKNAEIVARLEESIGAEDIAGANVSEQAATYLQSEELNAKLLTLLKQLDNDQKRALLTLLNGG